MHGAGVDPPDAGSKEQDPAYRAHNHRTSSAVKSARGEQVLDDVRLGWRKLRQQPGFTIVAVLTLALGIGATSAVFSLVQGVLLTPPPYRDPDTLALIQPAPTEGRQVNTRRWSAAQWTEWQLDSKAFESFIIGAKLRMSRRDTPPTIIGVMPPGVRFLPSPATAQEPNYNVNALVDFWMPMAGNPERMKAPFGTSWGDCAMAQRSNRGVPNLKSS